MVWLTSWGLQAWDFGRFGNHEFLGQAIVGHDSLGDEVVEPYISLDQTPYAPDF